MSERLERPVEHLDLALLIAFERPCVAVCLDFLEESGQFVERGGLRLGHHPRRRIVEGGERLLARQRDHPRRPLGWWDVRRLRVVNMGL
jgi:hypothetical protein